MSTKKRMITISGLPSTATAELLKKIVTHRAMTGITLLIITPKTGKKKHTRK